jgi:methyl-accepting chemotaxis protein
MIVVKHDILHIKSCFSRRRHIMIQTKSVKFKISASAIGCFFVGMAAILAVMIFYLQSAFGASNQQMLMEMGQNNANVIANTLENPLSFLSGLCSIVEAQIQSGHTDREALQGYIFRAFDKFSASEGTALMMEPDVYDGRDRAYRNTDYGTPTSGRISYYYFRENGQTKVLPQVEEDDQEFVQPYYVTPKERKAPTYSDPYLYEFDGKSVSMITASYPMIGEGGNVLGVATVDLYLDSIHQGLSAEKIFDTGYMVVVSEAGSILYCPDLSLVGEDAKAAGLWYERPAGSEAARVSSVKSFVNGAAAKAATLPLKLGQSDSKFYISVVAPDREANAALNTLLAIMLGIFALVGLVIFFVVRYATDKIVSPLGSLTAFMKKAGEAGDLAVSPAEQESFAKNAAIRDEIGECIGHTATFVTRMLDVDNALRSIAAGDLTADVRLLSERDTLGKSLKGMSGNLNKMFSEIRNSSAQVSVGARQIADGAQSLAQGASEQASTVDELSNAIAGITGKTKSNAGMAGEAARLADRIRGSAETGSRQMDEMMEAVKGINTASQSIGKVIKTIDDIAFQTNILALNAAVEAARAGEHGKGFAVVAEEVRNLASKSAEAAKDTGAMIQNSVEKADLGVRIAAETASSLSEIVAGINESTGLIMEIAKSSEEQSEEITKINAGIDQVARVVQQNSATAEESAASSQEMSSQSGILEKLISQFRLQAS